MDNRSTILACALDLFAARGYDAVGVQEVAEAAGVTKPTLYHYFGSKLGLLRALVETYARPFNESVRAAADYHGDLPGTLTKIGQAYFEFARQNPVYYRMQLALSFAPRDGEAFPVLAAWNAEQYRAVEDLFAAAVREHGNLRGKQRLYAANLIGLLNTCIALALNGYATLDEDLLYQTVRQFQYGIYSG